MSERLAFVQCVDDPRDLPVVICFPEEFAEIRVAFRIQQAQAGKVALLAELFGRRRQEHEAFGMRRQFLDGRIFPADPRGRPLHVVSLVDDEHVPARLHRLLEPRAVSGDEPAAAENELGVQERIGVLVVLLDRAHRSSS